MRPLFIKKPTEPKAATIPGVGAAGQGSPADIEALREMLLRLEVRTPEAGELRARLQITERAEFTLREDLEREHERASWLEEDLRELRGRASRS